MAKVTEVFPESLEVGLKQISGGSGVANFLSRLVFGLLIDRFKCKISLNRKMKHWSFTMSTQVSVYNVRDRISPCGHTTFHILDKSGAFQEQAELKSHVFTSWT